MYYYWVTKYSKKNVLLCALFAGLFLCSCSKTPLNAPEASLVTFTIEWPTSKSATAPKTGTIYLYPAAGGEPIAINSIADKSAPVHIPQGDYNVLVYNENLSTVKTRNPGAYDQFEAFLEPLAQTVNNTPTTVIPEADYLYLLSGKANRQIKVVAGTSYNFKLNPAPATKTFRFVVTVQSNIDLAGVGAALTGLASRLNLSQAAALPQDVFPMVVPFELDPTTRTTNVLALGVVETFGVDPSNRSAGSNMLHLEIFPKTANPNLQTTYSFDLTKDFDQHLEGNANLDILIEIGSPTPPIPPDPDPPGPTDPVVLKIIIRVVPWAVEDGGSIDSYPI